MRETTPLVDRVRARLAADPAVPSQVAVAALVRQEAGGLVGDGDVLDAVRATVDELSGAGVLEPLLRLTGAAPERMTAARARVLAAFADYGNLGFAPTELAQLAGVSPGVVAGLEAQDVLVREVAPRDGPYPRLDPDGAYIRRFVPELVRVPAERIHEPWTMTDAEQRASGCRVGPAGSADYPAPIVDHENERRAALAMLEEGKARRAREN